MVRGATVHRRSGLRKLDLEPATVRGGYRLQIVGIGAEDDIASPQGPLDDCGVHDIRGLSPGLERPHRASQWPSSAST